MSYKQELKKVTENNYSIKDKTTNFYVYKPNAINDENSTNTDRNAFTTSNSNLVSNTSKGKRSFIKYKSFASNADQKIVLLHEKKPNNFTPYVRNYTNSGDNSTNRKNSKQSHYLNNTNTYSERSNDGLPHGNIINAANNNLQPILTKKDYEEKLNMISSNTRLLFDQYCNVINNLKLKY